jgi:hypothetical protein
MKILQLLPRQLGNCLLLIAALTASSLAGAATISMTASTASVMPGQSVSVRFGISGLTGAAGDSLSGFDLDILYDNARLQFDSYGFLDTATGINQLDLAEAGQFGFFGEATGSGGVIDVFGLSGNSAAILDLAQAASFQFLSLNFTALGGVGPTFISVDLQDSNLLILDSGSSDLAVNFANSSLMVDIGQATGQVPEPQSPLLILAGALALALATSKRWRARTCAAAGVLALSLAASAPAAAQAPAPEPAAAAVAVSAVITEVQGKRVLLRLSSGELRWVSAEQELSKADIGKKVSAKIVARGDTFLMSDIAISN